MENKIKERLTEYLTFDYTKIINEDIDKCYIFGGAIRDSIANQKINDIDILCLPNSMRKIESVLESNGYTHSTSIGMLHISQMYKEVHCIFEPHNWIKIVDGEVRIVQLLRPAFGGGNLDTSAISGHSRGRSREKIKAEFETLDYALHYLLGQVDISCCGVHFSHSYGLRESVKGAISDCLTKNFRILKDTEMYNPTRIVERRMKLQGREWKMSEKSYERQFKLERLVGEKNYFLKPNVPNVPTLSDQDFFAF